MATRLPSLLVRPARRISITWTFLASGRPRVRRLSNPPLPAENQTPCDSYKRPVLPRAQATETKNSVLRPRAESDAGAVITGVSMHHSEAIRRMDHFDLPQSLPLASVALPLEPH